MQPWMARITGGWITHFEQFASSATGPPLASFPAAEAPPGRHRDNLRLNLRQLAALHRPQPPLLAFPLPAAAVRAAMARVLRRRRAGQPRGSGAIPQMIAPLRGIQHATGMDLGARPAGG
jgi:hypothetical protein